MSKKRPRMGRPPKAPGDAKASTFSVRLRADERAAIEVAAKRAGVKASEWARQVLLDAVTSAGAASVGEAQNLKSGLGQEAI